jgi:hypothetical protein
LNVATTIGDIQLEYIHDLLEKHAANGRTREVNAFEFFPSPANLNLRKPLNSAF